VSRGLQGELSPHVQDINSVFPHFGQKLGAAAIHAELRIVVHLSPLILLSGSPTEFLLSPGQGHVGCSCLCCVLWINAFNSDIVNDEKFSYDNWALPSVVGVVEGVRTQRHLDEHAICSVH